MKSSEITHFLETPRDFTARVDYGTDNRSSSSEIKTANLHKLLA